MSPVFNIKNIKDYVLDGMEKALREKYQNNKTHDTEQPPRTDQGVEQRFKGDSSLEDITALVLVGEAGKQFPAVA